MKIGILYNLVENVRRGFAIDALSDNEIVGTVEHVRRALAAEHEVIPVRIRRELLPCLSPKSFDIIINLCEGMEGEVKGESWAPTLLDILGIPYTGSNSFTLALCLDKLMTKQLLKASGIPTPAFQLFTSPDQELDPALSFPLMVKPVGEDASVGITVDSVVKDQDGLARRVDFLLRHYRQPALVEEYIDGRELNVAILGNGRELETLPISEIRFDFGDDQPGIVSYEAKWLPESEFYQKTVGICPASLPETVENELRQIALAAYRLTGCRDYARVDFRLKDSRPYLLEVNPNPGINTDSGFFRSAQTAGMSYQALVKRLLSEALGRYQREGRQQHETVKTRAGTTARLNAFPVRFTHLPLLLKWFNDPGVSKYMEDPEMRYSKEFIIEKFFVLNPESIDLIISEQSSGRELGFCSLYDINRGNQSAEISFLIGEKEFLGKGYGKEMVQLLLKTGFGELELNSLFATVTAENRRAVRVFRQLGFKKVGIRREYQMVGREKLDEILFEMLRSDYGPPY